MRRVLIVGGSDAGISAGLRIHELDHAVRPLVVVADHYPNFSICGIPYHISGEVPDWRDLAHRGRAELEAAGLDLKLGTRAVGIDPDRHTVRVNGPDGSTQELGYDQLIVATGAVPQAPPIAGLAALGPEEGVHRLHTMDDTFAVAKSLEAARSAVIVGAGYIGVEMAEALRARGVHVSLLERLPQVLPRTLDPGLADQVSEQMQAYGVEVAVGVGVTSISRSGEQLVVETDNDGARTADVVLVVTGVRPDTDLAAAAGVELGKGGAIAVDAQMRTNLPDIFAAGDCVHTHHRLLPSPTYQPLGTTAHKQGRVAGENALGGTAVFGGSVGTQVVRVFDLVVAATGLRDEQASEAGYQPLTIEATADDHKHYYPGATPIRIRLTGDKRSGRLLGAQLVGHVGAEIAKRVDVYATSLSYGTTVASLSDLDLSYTPPLGSPFDAVQVAAQAWERAARS